ncbi:MAG: type II secretion system F family protein [Oscillospiraceae bacterium]|nr:type II secretion system F family protein [Oscillospiraceae bacterium]
MKTLSPKNLSDFCLELRFLLGAGVDVGEGFVLLSGGRRNKSSKALADYFSACADCDVPLSDRLTASGLFPQYFTETVRLGEKSGRLDETLLSLSKYYEKKSSLSDGLRGAVVYPLTLFVAMAAVVVVLLTRVLPVFNEIYAQLGTQMNGFAVSLLNAGKWLMAAQAVILSAIAVFLTVGLAVYLIPPVRRTASRSLDARFGGRGVLGQISAAKLVSAISVAVSSGLDPVRALDLAESTCSGSVSMCRKIKGCRERLGHGESFEDCMAKARIFSERESRLLSLALSSGGAEEVLKEIARRTGNKVSSELDARLGRLGPAMILAVCAIVGLTLLSVMLPAIGILSSLA